MKGIKPAVSEKCDFQGRDKSELIAVLCNFWTIRNLTHRSTRVVFWSNPYPQLWLFLIKSWCTKSNLRSLGKRIWISRFFQNDSNFRKFLTFRNVTQGKLPPAFQWISLLQVRDVWLNPSWRNWTLFYWRRKSCNIKDAQNYLRFLVLP